MYEYVLYMYIYYILTRAYRVEEEEGSYMYDVHFCTCNPGSLKIQTEAKNSNKVCISYSTKAAIM